MKKYLAIVLAFAMVLCCFAACGGKTENETTTDASSDASTDASTEEVTDEAAEPATDEGTDAAEEFVIELGKSGLTLTTEKKYENGELTAEDTDESQVAYFKSEETGVDFDVYEWVKADGETLDSTVAEEAKEFDAEVKTTELNGFAAAYYNAVEEYEGTEYNTVTYIIENGDEFVEIVFWLDGENAEAEVAAILATLAKTEEEAPVAEDVIELGNSGLKITPEKKYEKGELTAEDTDDNQVAYFQSEETGVDFDVYEWAKADGETLDSTVAEEAKEFDAEVKTTELNGFAAAYYNAVEEYEGTEYNTVTYIIENGDEFVEIVFWLDGENAEAEVAAILATLTK